jgi:NAD(P)-dependent dehydrogenase (short-subunit alcohol dehydrogenase family)
MRGHPAGVEFAGDGRALVAAAVAAFGRLDILVANHGIWPAEDVPISEMADQQWRRTLAVNLDSVFGLVQAAVAQMDRQTPASGEARGHIVLISSTAGQRGEANHADYAVTKGALISLTKSLSSELAPRGIMVNCVAPGWVATEMSAAAVGDPEMGAKIRAGIPGGPGGDYARDCRAGAVPVHAAGWIHLRRGVERERRLGSGGIKRFRRGKDEDERTFADGGGAADAGLAYRSRGRRRATTMRRRMRSRRARRWTPWCRRSAARPG